MHDQSRSEYMYKNYFFVTCQIYCLDDQDLLTVVVIVIERKKG